jgi:hypothetical protein
MTRWNNESFLEVVEELAQWNGTCDSEEEFSKQFDEMLEEFGDPEKMTPTDIRCAFSDYISSQSSEGFIHFEQANEYGYVGKFEDE